VLRIDLCQRDHSIKVDMNENARQVRELFTRILWTTVQWRSDDRSAGRRKSCRGHTQSLIQSLFCNDVRKLWLSDKADLGKLAEAWQPL